MAQKPSFVYCWTDHKKEKLYVGSHKGTIDDGYICSSKLMLEQYNVRQDDFTRQIIAEGTWDDCRKLESKILQSVNAKNNPDYYNYHNNSPEFRNKGHTEETRKKISLSSRGNKNAKGAIRSEEYKAHLSLIKKTNPLKLTEEYREKLRKGRKGLKPSLGMIHSEETKKKISVKMSGNNNPFFGKKHSTETKLKISVANTKKKEK